MDRVDVIVIGSGPAGMHAALELRRRGLAAVILERDAEPGGVPRWCHHHTFPCRVKKRLFDGPGYVRAWLAEVRAAGIPIRIETSVLRLDANRPAVEFTSPQGSGILEARAVLLAAGAREAHRHQRLAAGDRVPGVFTTASLFQQLYVSRDLPGRRFVVFGSEDVSYSCVNVLRSHGMRVIAVVEPGAATRSWPAARWYFERVLRVPHFFGIAEFAVHGRSAVERVSFRPHGSDNTVQLACDSVVFTGGFTPNAELVRAAGLAFNTASRGPSVNQALQTSASWCFAAGNCLRGVVSGDEAGLEGRMAARSVAAYLEGRLPAAEETPLIAEAPFACCTPDRLSPGAPGMARIALWPGEHLRGVEVAAEQSGRVLWRRRIARLQPGRRIFVPVQDLAPAGPARVRFLVRQLTNQHE